jgi:hypothetical protein
VRTKLTDNDKEKMMGDSNKTFTVPAFTLVQYKRDKNRNPVGVVVARKVGEEVRYGFSLCRKGDRFNKARALEIALGRVNAKVTICPNSLEQTFDIVMDRAARYFKQRKVCRKTKRRL